MVDILLILEYSGCNMHENGFSAIKSNHVIDTAYNYSTINCVYFFYKFIRIIGSTIYTEFLHMLQIFPL